MQIHLFVQKNERIFIKISIIGISLCKYTIFCSICFNTNPDKKENITQYLHLTERRSTPIDQIFITVSLQYLGSVFFFYIHIVLYETVLPILPNLTISFSFSNEKNFVEYTSKSCSSIVNSKNKGKEETSKEKVKFLKSAFNTSLKIKKI